MPEVDRSHYPYLPVFMYHFLPAKNVKALPFLSLFSNKKFRFMGCVSKEHDLGLSSEVCSCPDEDDSEVELGLGLSVGNGVKSYGRIMMDFHFPCASSSSAHSVSPPRSCLSEVVGWPPPRTYRMNSLVCQTKSPTIEEFSSTVEKSKIKSKNNNDPNKEKRLSKTSSLFVKVTMDGVVIGRKVDLSAHTSYQGLAHTLNAMFAMPNTRLLLFHGSSQYMLTYEDKEGDWMLVGDVPWEMFLSSVKRLRIMRTSDAHTLSPAFLERNGQQRTKPLTNILLLMPVA